MQKLEIWCSLCIRKIKTGYAKKSGYFKKLLELFKYAPQFMFYVTGSYVT